MPTPETAAKARHAAATDPDFNCKVSAGMRRHHAKRRAVQVIRERIPDLAALFEDAKTVVIVLEADDED